MNIVLPYDNVLMAAEFMRIARGCILLSIYHFGCPYFWMHENVFLAL